MNDYKVGFGNSGTIYVSNNLGYSHTTRTPDLESLRDHFAISYLSTFNGVYKGREAGVAEDCYAMADAMMKARG